MSGFPFFVAPLLAAAGCFFCGALPAGPWICRAFGGADPQKTGSGNVGATNVARSAGLAAGGITLAADFLKSFLPLLLAAREIPGHPFGLAGCALAAVMGSCFSPFLRGRGGKGVAASLGALGAVAPFSLPVFLAAFVPLFFWRRTVSLASLGGLAVAALFLYLTPHSGAQRLLISGIGLLVLWQHRENLRRLWRGDEKPFTPGPRNER